MRKSMMNFWQATPSDVLRSIGDGDADDDAEHDEENDEFGRGDSPVNCGLRFRSPPVMGDCGWVKGWMDRFCWKMSLCSSYTYIYAFIFFLYVSLILGLSRISQLCYESYAYFCSCLPFE